MLNQRRLVTALLIIFSSTPLTAHAETAPSPAGAPTSAPGVIEKIEDSGNITLDFKEADINTVLRVMSIKSNINIVAGPEVQGTVTIRLENVPWDKALEVVLRTYGYVYEREGNVIRVTTRENLAAEPVVTQTYVLNYTKASEIQSAVQDMLTERGRIKIAERTNALVITDIPTNIYHIGEIIKRLDKVTPQAYIDSKVVNTALGITENLGIEWQTGDAGNLGRLAGSIRPTTFPFVSNPKGGAEKIADYVDQFFPATSATTTATQNSADPRFFPLATTATPTNSGFTFGTMNFSNFSAILQMLRARANTKVISNPRIVVLNNQAAKVQVGQQIPLPTFERNQTTGQVEVTGYSYRDVGVVLNVTPHINSEDEILVDLKPEVSSNGGNVNFGTFQIPFFNITQAVTQVLIRSGETIAIGGLLTDNSTTNEAKVPYLGDIPVLGKLFRSKRQSAGSGNSKVETLFFVTVTMVNTEGQPVQYTVTPSPQAPKTAAATQAQSGKNKVETLPVSGDRPKETPPAVERKLKAPQTAAKKLTVSSETKNS